MPKADKERKEAIERLFAAGYIKSRVVKDAMTRVDRRDFVPQSLRKYAYVDSPMPIPGNATISAMHIHAITLSELDLKPGDKALEVGAGSGILLAYLKELVGKSGLVVGTEINKETYEFAKQNLEKTGYDVILENRDGSRGFPERSPYDKIAVSAACEKIPDELVSELKSGGKLIAPVGKFYQQLILLEKRGKKTTEKDLGMVVFVLLKQKESLL